MILTFKRKVNITRIKKEQKVDEIDIVLIESAINLIVNSKSIVNIICLPRDLKELAVGFLFSIGIINSYMDIKELSINELESKIIVDLHNNKEFNSDEFEQNVFNRVIDTTCGVPSPWRDLIKSKLEEAKDSLISNIKNKVDSKIIFSSIVKMQKNTLLFRETGGCHGAAIFDLDGNLISIKEDIGRHNAIDKVIGELLINGDLFSDKILTTTGRLTGDSVLKAARANIPIIASLSAAVESGIRIAFAYGITLIGFVRGNSMNIYSRADRIIA
ncbi:MAG: formate dehydrogenase accessory sulfurtransferase FdhD [Promethearchaeota archaeon]